MRVAVVINTAAGGLVGREEVAAEVAERLAEAGLDARIIHDNEAADLAGRLDLAIAEGAEAVVVGGGDGTIAAAAARLAGTSTVLGILPMGTMNLLAKDLGIPLELEAAAASLAHGEPRAIDVAEVNGHVFLCASVLGLPTHLGRYRERHRGDASIRSRIAFAVAAVRATLRHPPLRLLVDLGEGPVRVWTRAATVVAGGYAEGFGQFMRRERLDRGELVLYLARGFGAWWAIRLLFGMLSGSWRNQGLLDERASKAVSIRSGRPRLRVMNDGEALLLEPPLRYTIRPRALNVIVPRPPEHPPAGTSEPVAAPAGPIA